jgi:hypothetical protein
MLEWLKNENKYFKELSEEEALKIMANKETKEQEYIPNLIDRVLAMENAMADLAMLLSLNLDNEENV